MFRDEYQQNFEVVLKMFSEEARKNYGNHAFEAGYLQSLSVSMLGMIPKKYRQQFINDMVRAVAKQRAEVADKQDQNRVLERV